MSASNKSVKNLLKATKQKNVNLKYIVHDSLTSWHKVTVDIKVGLTAVQSLSFVSGVQVSDLTQWKEKEKYSPLFQ